jgi:hypothetical protein
MQAMAVPIYPDKVDTWRSWCAELTGPRKAEFDDMNRRHGLTTHAAWHQANPDGSDVAVIVIEGPGSDGFLAALAHSQDPFDVWFRSVIEDIHPMDFSAPPPPAPVRVL